MTSVALVLLIIFMVLSPSLTGAKLAKARTASVVGEGAVTVDVDDKGKYFIDDRPVADDRLAQGLREAFAAHPDETRLYLEAYDEVEYSRILKLFDAARDAGVRRVTAVVDLPHSSLHPRR
jgi:biopolymer transport protein ExbD